MSYPGARVNDITKLLPNVLHQALEIHSILLHVCFNDITKLLLNVLHQDIDCILVHVCFNDITKLLLNVLHKDMEIHSILVQSMWVLKTLLSCS
jgi:hypothetical protein